MILYRVSPYPLVYSKPGLTALTTYDWTILDEFSSVLSTGTETTNAEGTLSFDFPFVKYDQRYVVELYSGTSLVDQTPVEVVRPYFPDDSDPAWETNEALARSVVDAGTGGFYYQNTFYETEGIGGDYLPIPYRINKLLRVWENGTLVFDAENEAFANVYTFAITKDRSSIYVSGENDNLSGAPSVITVASSDSYGGYPGNGGTFSKGTDYTVEMESGWFVVPEDIALAAKLLTEDIKCGATKYLSKYIMEYSTDQYKVKYGAGAQHGTGNSTVDGILSKYTSEYIRASVL